MGQATPNFISEDLIKPALLPALDARRRCRQL